MRRPGCISQVEDSSRSRNAKIMAVERAELHAAGAERHEVRRDPVELHQHHADHLARSGMWSVMPSSFSTPRQYAVSLNNGAR